MTIKNKKTSKHSKHLNFVDDLTHLIFPSSCLVCENELAKTEKNICSFCENNLSKSNFHLFTEASPLDKLFWGRVQLKATYTHLLFEKSKGSQNILFSLKYKNNPGLGVYFGKQIGEDMQKMERFSDIDALIPVPLHYKKEFIRGYNQSEVIAQGISQAMNIPVDVTSVVRNTHTETQTKKSRFQRWDNVSKVFDIKSNLKGYKHIVLVDDVITTGSTMEALIQSIRKEFPQLEISVVTLAIA